MMNIHRAALLWTTAIGIVVTLPAAAQTEAAPGAPAADQPAAPASAGPDDRAMQDIVVTARRREESLQTTPITVTAYTGAQLQAKGVTDFARLTQITPGVNFDAFPKAAPRPFFRGIGSANQGAGGDPSSVAFLDGVYLGRAAMLGIDFYDMQRVEVLKGPQGTLFGKNVVGGAVNFITAKPVGHAEASAQLTIGEYTQLNGNLMLNVPIADGVATRVVLGAVSNDGFRKTVDGRPMDDENKISARMQTSVDLAPGTTLLLSGDIATQDMSQGARYNVRVLPFQATGDKKGYADYDSPRRGNPDHLGGVDTKTGGARAEIVSDALGFATFTATAAWRTLDFDSTEDFDGTNAAQNAANGVQVSGIQVFQREKADSYSGEARLNSSGSGPFSWVAGLYYNKDDITRDRESQTSATPTTVNLYSGEAHNRSYAAYGELQYKFDFGLGLFGGARYTDEKKRYEITRFTGPIAAPVVNYTTVGNPGETRQKLVTWRAGADFQLNRNIFAFGSVSTGFKSGAFQEQPSAALARLATAPEKVTNYEIGLKTDWFDRHLRFNVSGFIAKYKDFQTFQVVPDASAGIGASRTVTDTGNATIKGIETETVVAPFDWVDLTARYTYLDATFDSLVQTSAILADGTPAFRDLRGNRLSRTPKHALNADLGFSTPERSWGWLRAVVSADYQSEIFDDNDNDFIEYRRPRTLWDASMTYHINDRFSAQAWIRNLTDETYRVHQVETGGGVFVLYGAPRQYGLTLNAKF
jgi:iron complex outermembrane receptor protein